MSIAVENHAKRKFKAGELVICLAVNQMRTADIPYIAASCDFDAMFIDLEHTPVSLETTSLMCVSAIGSGVTPIVRVATQDGSLMARVLDGGAQGLMIPHVQTAEEARIVVDNCKFQPAGHRSAAGTGPLLRYQPVKQKDINAALNDELLLIAMLETPQAVENASEIAAVPGIDVLHVGAADMSNQLGIPQDYRNPIMQAIFDKVLAACKANGKSMGVGGVRGDAEVKRQLVEKGVQYLTTGSDVSYFTAAARADVAALKALKAK